LILITFFNSWIFAQNPGIWGISVNYQFINPIGSLGNWFKATPSSFNLSLGKFTSEQWFWEVKAEMIQFLNENQEKLYYDDLDLKLEIYGIGAQAQYYLIQNRSKVQPYVGGGAGIYRWFGHRGEYQLEDRIVPKRNQNDWSWGFNLGIGLDIYIYKNWAVIFSTDYQIIVGELWPALA
jgi:opacity protein-like surface antigen